MTTGEAVLWTLVALIGLAGSALASGLEMGVYALGRLGLETRALRGDPAAIMLRGEIGRTDRLLSTLLVHNNVCNYIGVLGVSALLGATGMGPIPTLIVQSIVVTPIILIFGESLPKELFRTGADRLTYLFAPVLRGLRVFYVLLGVVPLVMIAGRVMTTLIGGAGLGGSSDARQRMANTLKEAGGPRGMSDEHSTLLDRALAVGRGRVGDEMLSWSMAQKIHADWSHHRIRRALGPTPATTVPVTDGHGRVLGIASAISLLAGEPTEPERLRPAVLVSPDTPSIVAIRRILAAEADLAIVVQHNKPVGVVSLNDLTEMLLLQ
ncbi:MAG: CNNM domain-containing protein [Phycisphaerales bacterium JB060]